MRASEFLNMKNGVCKSSGLREVVSCHSRAMIATLTTAKDDDVVEESG